MLEADRAADIIRAALEGETNPYIQLVVLEQGSLFCTLPPDLEALRSELGERLGPVPIPPVADAKSWGRKPSSSSSSPGSDPVPTRGPQPPSKPSP